MRKWFRLRLKKSLPWWWRILHLKQSRRVNRWLREVEEKVQKEMEAFPETVTWDHLPKPAWRDIKLREDVKE